MQNLSRAAAVGKKMEHNISEPRPAPLPSAPPSSLRPIGSLNLTPEKEQRRKPLAEAQQNHILSPQSSLTPRSKASKVILNIWFILGFIYSSPHSSLLSFPQLLNVPHHVTRYTQLQQVEVSETSFEELLIEKKAKGRTKETSDRTRKIPEPSLHKLYPIQIFIHTQSELSDQGGQN